jgi:hypothetical protein
LLQALLERRDAGPPFVIVSPVHEHANAPNALGLLCVSGERPGHYRTDEKCDELAPLHVPPKDHALCNTKS